MADGTKEFCVWLSKVPFAIRLIALLFPFVLGFICGESRVLRPALKYESAVPTASPSSNPPLRRSNFHPYTATCSSPIPLLKFRNALSLGDLADQLTATLLQCHYVECGVYRLEPDDGPGFAIVSHVERIMVDGTPDWENRWTFDPPTVRGFSIRMILAALFSAQPGYYRVIALVVSKLPLDEKGSLSADEADALIHGYKSSPDDYYQVPFTKDYRCTAYVYEFERKSRNDDPAFHATEGNITAVIHLASTGLWSALQSN